MKNIMIKKKKDVKKDNKNYTSGKPAMTPEEVMKSRIYR